MQTRFRWFVSVEILEEYRRVLFELASGRLGIDVDRIFKVVSMNTEVVRAIAFAKPVCTDPDDDKFLGTAIAAGAEFVVSGDNALLRVGKFRGVQVVTARAFLGNLKSHLR